MCEAPPHKKNSITDFACPPDFVGRWAATTDWSPARKRFDAPNFKPAIPQLEATKNVRRLVMVFTFGHLLRLAFGLLTGLHLVPRLLPAPAWEPTVLQALPADQG